ncbi:unnamed protein product [Lymnaea stagnalis]|uniref:Uncharacterized protein n=1 Tax=Lymnaea stagnalis TaxID=6523 RepID=A0AAV2IC18_LYMST
MFSTHSSVTQLKPETITKCLKDSEERHWSVGDLANLSGQGSHEGSDQDLGSMLLGQSTCLSKIHGYFSQLESRKCCLHLACRRSTFNSMRVLPTSVPADDGSSKNKQPAISINILDNKSLRTFKHAYLCAVYPVLAAPDPPTTPSPEMLDSLRFIASETFRGSISRNFPESIPPSRSRSRSVTPYSLHDSGVEEADETGFIPMESICEQLQRAFGLSKAVFRQYEALLVKAYAKKSSQMLLAEELSGQLILLETNSHPFYSPSHFITQNGYDLWQKQERNHISELLNKFWQLSLPFPGYSQDLISELSTIHEDYHVLLTKLLEYERQFRQEDENSANTTGFTPLSSASSRLLLEFGMRYGIGELYRKVSLLHCLTSEFCASVGHLTYMNSLVASIQHMLPSNKTSLVMVKQELDILHSSLQVLKAQTCKALSQMKYLFPGNRPIEGLECLLSLLQTVLSLINYLAPSNNPKECLDTYVRHTIQNIFRPTYEMFKTVALEDLSQGRTEEMDLRLLSVLIEDIREDVSDYRNNFDGSFMQFCYVSQMAASSFYEFLMEDVERFTGYHTRYQTSPVIELQLVAIMYRLNKLDEDWKLYILPQQQTWRRCFLPCLFQWCQVLQTHMQNFVVEAVSNDVVSWRYVVF